MACAKKLIECLQLLINLLRVFDDRPTKDFEAFGDKNKIQPTTGRKDEHVYTY
jgi:hypothetical protein